MSSLEPFRPDRTPPSFFVAAKLRSPTQSAEKFLSDPFGRCVPDPARLDRAGRVHALRRLAGALQAGSVEARWLGRALGAWLQTGGTLEQALGVAPARGSRMTAPAMAQQARRDEALSQLVHEFGDARALRILSGAEPCPDAHMDLFLAARELGCTASRSALRRARQRVASSG